MIPAGQSLSGDGPIHRLDPRVKILWAVAFSILVFQAGPAGGLLLTALLAAVGALSGIPFRRFLSALGPLWVLVALLFLLHAFFSNGPVLFALPGLPIALTSTGLARGFTVAWQFLCLVSAGLFLTLTTPPGLLVLGLERLLKPTGRLGVPYTELAFTVSIALRFLPMLHETFLQVRDAQRSRGSDTRSGTLPGRLRAVSALVAPLLLGTFRQADALVEAMEARGYRPGPRTGLTTPRFTPPDVAACVLLGLIVALMTLPLALRLF